MSSSFLNHLACPSGQRRKLVVVVVSAVLLVGLTAASSLAAISESDSAGPRGAVGQPGSALELQEGLDGLVAAGVPGAILLVRDGDRTVLLASGLGDIAGQTPMRPDDRFRIASLTKSYVATVVLQLVGEGKLALDDSVERRLPGAIPNGDKITIRQLLNHTSGLFDFSNDPRLLKPYLSGNLGYHWAPRKLVKIAVSHKPLFAPGARHSYSNTNYVIAGLIVEAVTKKPLGSELKRRIFQPVHLTSTTFPTTPRIAGAHAHGYYVFGTPPATDVTGISPYPWAAGAIVSTATDVADFYRALLSGRLLEPKLLNAMKKTVSEGKGGPPGKRYGLGLERSQTSCGTAWGHTGSFGYATFAFTSADGARQAVLMVNLDGASWPEQAGTLVFKLIDSAYCSTA